MSGFLPVPIGAHRGLAVAAGATAGDAAGPAVHRLRPLLGQVTAIDHQGSRLAAAGGRVCCVWATRSHALLLRIVVPQPIAAVALSRNGRWLALAAGRQVQVLALPGGAAVLEYEHAAPVQSLHIAAHAPRIASADTAGDLQVRTLECGTVAWCQAHAPGRAIVFLDGTGLRLAVDGDDASQLFDLDGRQPPAVYPYADDEPTGPLARPIGKVLLAHRGRTLRFFDYDSGEQRCARRIELGAEITGIDISADDSTCLAATRPGAIHLFDLYAARWQECQESFTNPLLAAKFGRGRTVYAAGGEALVLQIEGGRHVRSYGDESPPIVAAAWSAARRAVLVADRDGGVSRYDLGSGRRIDFVGHAGSVSAIACAGDQVATGAYDGSARLWHDDGRLLATFSPGDGPVQALAFDAARGALWVGTWGGRVIAYDLRSGAATTLCRLGESIRTLGLDTHGRRLVAGDNGGRFQVHDLEGGARLELSAQVAGPAYRARFDGDGSVLVTSADGLRRYRPGSLLPAAIHACADARWFDALPDGRFAVLGLHGALKLFEPGSLRGVAERRIDDARPHRVVFGAGDRLFTGSGDGALRVFDRDLVPLAGLQRLRRGVLWTTAATAAHPGWFCTDRPELLAVGRLRDEALEEWGDDDPRRQRHLATFNSASHTMAVVAGSNGAGGGAAPTSGPPRPQGPLLRLGWRPGA